MKADESGHGTGSRAEARYGVVLLLLLATFVVLMTGSTSKWMRPITVSLSGTTLIASLIAADVSPRLRRIAALIVVAAVVTSLSIVGIGQRSGDGLNAILAAALVLVAPFAIARAAIRRRIVDLRTILAALCIYVLFGMLWAFIFTGINNLHAAPFFVQASKPTSADFLYFSYITQLTVGYGDLTAAGNFGRACAVLEALLGQVYLVTVIAVLVSRLVPRHPGGSQSGE